VSGHATEPAVVGSDAMGRYLKLGDIVRLSSDIAHLYDDTGDQWIIDGTSDEFNAPGVLRSAPGSAILRLKSSATLKIRNLTTGIWVHAPASWVLPYRETAPSDEHAVDEIGVLAKVIVDQRDTVSTVAALAAWARGYIARKGASEDEPLFPSGTIQKIITSLIRLGELQPSAAYSAADIVAAIERLPKRQHDCGVPPAISDMLKELGYGESWSASAVATIIRRIHERAVKGDDLQNRVDAFHAATKGI
jgi:hypothetical protein